MDGLLSETPAMNPSLHILRTCSCIAKMTIGQPNYLLCDLMYSLPSTYAPILSRLQPLPPAAKENQA